MAIRDSLSITLLPATLISANGTSTPVINLKGMIDLLCYLSVTAVPTGGTPTLDVYLQTSLDSVTWQDMAHAQFTTSTGTKYLQIAGEAGGLQNIVTQSDAALALNQVVQGPWADQLRLKWVFAAGGSTGSYTMNSNGYIK